MFEPYKRAEGYQKFCEPECRTKAWKREHGQYNPRVQKSDKPSQADRILERLRQGPATALDLIRASGSLRPGARIRDLRKAGVCILGPHPWRRPDGSIEQRTTEPTAEGHPVYRLEE